MNNIQKFFILIGLALIVITISLMHNVFTSIELAVLTKSNISTSKLIYFIRDVLIGLIVICIFGYYYFDQKKDSLWNRFANFWIKINNFQSPFIIEKDSSPTKKSE